LDVTEDQFFYIYLFRPSNSFPFRHPHTQNALRLFPHPFTSPQTASLTSSVPSLTAKSHLHQTKQTTKMSPSTPEKSCVTQLESALGSPFLEAHPRAHKIRNNIDYRALPWRIFYTGQSPCECGPSVALRLGFKDSRSHTSWHSELRCYRIHGGGAFRRPALQQGRSLQSNNNDVGS
jgi:hypothetical protein